MSARLPKRRRRLAKASAQPKVSPSGVWWPARKNVRPRRTVRTMASRALLRFSAAADRLFIFNGGRGFLFVVDFLQQFEHAGGAGGRIIENEVEKRDAPEAFQVPH